jgi:hypothetical protein
LSFKGGNHVKKKEYSSSGYGDLCGEASVLSKDNAKPEGKSKN